MYIDFHTHAFPGKIAEKAIEKLSYAGGALTPRFNGTIEDLHGALEKTDGRAVLLNIATKPAQQTSLNSWAASVGGGRLKAFGSVHPLAKDALFELERIRELGLLGVKFHAEYQDFFVDDPQMKPIYQKIASLGLITVFHGGMDLAFAPPCHCTPHALRKALPWFNGAPVVAAHFGGYLLWEAVIEELCGLPLYIDTSYSHGHIVKPYAQRIIDKHGPDKILFGSDSPWNDPMDEQRFLRSLELSETDLNKIFFHNASKLLAWPE